MLQGELVQCPYCGETIELLIDASAGEQHYIEDCSVCCRPIEIAVAVDEEAGVLVSCRAENEA
jgi:hypothetical protein